MLSSSLLGPRTGFALLLCSGALGVTACGSADSTAATNASSSSNASNADRDAQRIRLQQCLRKEGVDVPEPGSGGGGRGGLRGLTGSARDELQKALEGPCKSLATNAFGNLSEADRQEFQDRFQKFRQCMKDNGVDLPDRQAGGGPPAGGARIDRDDPDFQKAAKACEDVAPRRPGGGGGAGPGAPQ